jgi:hypothetical protein
MMDEETLELVIAFPDQSSNFALGHEAGRIFELLGTEAQDCFVLQTHFENREVIIRTGHYLGWAVEIIPTETEGWDSTTFTKTENHRERINPHGLRVVK